MKEIKSQCHNYCIDSTYIDIRKHVRLYSALFWDTCMQNKSIKPGTGKVPNKLNRERQMGQGKKSDFNFYYTPLFFSILKLAQLN